MDAFVLVAAVGLWECCIVIVLALRTDLCADQIFTHYSF